jgi:hypothetical protein
MRDENEEAKNRGLDGGRGGALRRRGRRAPRHGMRRMDFSRPFPIFRKILQKHGKQRRGLFARQKLSAY